jgi:sarcosine oxidase subunit beta
VKTIVCRCEDVTLAEVEDTFARGYFTVEEVKRFTGLGTGPCQGKECMVHTALLCAARSRKPPAEVAPFTSRPPASPAPLAIFARAGDDE